MDGIRFLDLSHKTLVLIKPDGVIRRSVGAVILKEVLNRKDVDCTAIAFMEWHADRSLIENHYSTTLTRIKCKKLREMIINYMTSYNLIGLILSENPQCNINTNHDIDSCDSYNFNSKKYKSCNFITQMRMIAGNTTEPEQGLYTIRSRQSINALINTIHTSDGDVEAQRELKVWLPYFNKYYQSLGITNSKENVRNQISEYIQKYLSFSGMLVVTF